ncbi:hypothetical protein GO613_17470 [Azoarcus communis]|uniref:hypothetical protein n=1 Tax=Parazoarcus communis TaxID=41977 RepID=UPI0014597953|nr:hypothetical protein [Parazoarcus communis]NMG49888.1 hypothetical protein [Parazoarcus communis]
MNVVEQALSNWKNSLPEKVELGGLYSRNQTAHKWKAPFRSLILRETVFWRLHDLLSQSYALHQQGHGLGARILLRSGFETLATLIYLNWITDEVLQGTRTFHDFTSETSVLLLGSRNKTTKHESRNIVTILKHCDKRYAGIQALYDDLCEAAHPNFEGTCFGYSSVDFDNHTTVFQNKWREMYADKHLDSMQLCMLTFEAEYNEVWPPLFNKLEAWIEEHDAELEATKPAE